MLDQSFTSENFRKIFDYENRKGFDLAARFFPSIVNKTKEIKEYKKTLSEKGKRIEKFKEFELELLEKEFEELKKRNEELSEEKRNKFEKFKRLKALKELEEEKEELLEEEFKKISLNINSNIKSGDYDNFLTLKKCNIPNQKCFYKIAPDDASSYFAIKQLQYNIRKLYKVKQSNRNNIISQLKNILDPYFPKYVIRLDIKAFYESISRKNLLQKIDQDALLTLSSRKIIHMMLKQYEEESGDFKGIPRGIGISAYLAELYMRNFDRKVKKHDEIIFYARYVDDIVAVFVEKPNTQIEETLEFICKEIRKLDLELNNEKTEILKFKKGNIRKLGLELNNEKIKISEKNLKGKNLTYLGYKMEWKNKELLINFTEKKLNRYRKRILQSFEDYKNQATTNEKKARKWLVKRIQFQTSNTRLHNNKNNVLIGCYYSNIFINNNKDFKDLDSCLKNEIFKLDSEAIKNKICARTLGVIKKRLRKCSFVNGFENKEFIQFKSVELKNIVELWKHEE